jgi:hypothetical protein
VTDPTPDLADLSPGAHHALAERRERVAADPASIRVLLPAAAREVARTPGTATQPGEPRLEDAVRVELLRALAAALAGDTDTLDTEVHDLYRFGDADERRAVLLALPDLGLGGRAVDLVHDALRTNDPRLVAAALGPYAAAELDAPAWRQGVLKCLFVGVPLRLVAGLAERTDDELRRMVADHAAERRAAGRSVPDDALPFLTTTSRET